MLDSRVYSRSAELSHKTTAYVPENETIRPLRDVIIVEPLDGYFSAMIVLIDEMKPLKGIVRAVGPGVYPRQYNGPKGARTKTWHGKQFRKTEVKVNDIVEFGGIERGGVPFQTVYWGRTLMLIAREEDVAGIQERDAA
jgi:hypothetical protein